MDKEDEKLLRDNFWEIECESPFEIRNDKDGCFASGQAAYMILDWLRRENVASPTYFVLRRANCGVIGDGKIHTDIIGVTTDEEYAKSKQSVFCYYEPVILLND